MRISKLFRWGMGVALVGFLLDQAHKWFMLTHTRVPSESIEVLPFFNLVMVWNTGVSFGMFNDGEDMGRWILIGVTGVIVIALCGWLWRVTHPFTAIAIGLVIGGAVGNIVDRVRFGAVADFFDFHVAGYHWPAFNIADSLIFIGVTMLLVEGWVIKSCSVQHTSDGQA